MKSCVKINDLIHISYLIYFWLFLRHQFTPILWLFTTLVLEIMKIKGIVYTSYNFWNNRVIQFQKLLKSCNCQKTTHIETTENSNRNFFLLLAQIWSHEVFNGLYKTEQISVHVLPCTQKKLVWTHIKHDGERAYYHNTTNTCGSAEQRI